MDFDSNGNLKVNVQSGGTSGTQYTEDAAAAANPVGNMLIAVRRDTLSASEVSTDGDNIALKATSKGELHVKAADTDVLAGAVDETAPASDTASSGLNGRLQRIAQRLTSLIALLPGALGSNGGVKVDIVGGSASGTEYTEDAAAAADPAGGMMMAVRRDTLSATEVSADGDNIAARTDSFGRLYVNAGSPGTKLTVTPVVETTALDGGDVAFATTEIANAVRYSGGFAILQDIIVIDKAVQKAQLRLVFLQANTAFGTLDSPPDIDDTEVLDVIGTVEIAVTDYVDLGGNSVATKTAVGLMLKPTTGTSVYFAASTSGTPTYAAADALVFRFGVLQA